MSLTKAIQNASQSVLLEYDAALREYKQACSEYTKIRIASVYPNAPDVAIVAHHRARLVFKEACKKYALARAKFSSEVMAAAGKMPELHDYELFAAGLETNTRAVHDQLRSKELGRPMSKYEQKAMEDFIASRKAREETEAETGTDIDSEPVSVPVSTLGSTPAPRVSSRDLSATGKRPREMRNEDDPAYEDFNNPSDNIL